MTDAPVDQVTEASAVPDDLRNVEETARFFSVSVPTFRTWIADGCPVVEKGKNGVGYKLSLRQVNAWRRDRDVAAAAEAEARENNTAQLAMELLGTGSLSGEGGTAALSAKQAGDLFRAEAERSKLALMRRELVRADDVQLALSRALYNIQSSLRAMPDRIATQLGWGEAEIAACRDQVDKALNDLADELAKIQAEPPRV